MSLSRSQNGYRGKVLALAMALLAILLVLQVSVAVKAFMGNVYSYNADVLDGHGDAVGARWSLGKATGWAGGDYRIHRRLGIVCTELGDTEGAIRTFEKTLRLAPNDVRTMLALTKLYSFQGRYEEADYLIDRLRVIVPTSWEVGFVAGLNAGVRGDHAKAIEEFKKAIERVSPPPPAVYAQMAVAYSALGDLPTALQYATQAVEADPENPEHHLLMSGLLLVVDQEHESVSHLQKALDLIGNAAPTGEVMTLAGSLFGLARSYLDVGLIPEAVEALAATCRLAPGFPSLNRLALDVLANLEHTTKDGKNSISEPRYAGACMKIGDILTSLEEWEAAERALAMAKRGLSRRDQVICEAHRAVALIQLKRYDAAVQAIREVQRAGQRDLNLDLMLADALTKSGNSAQARLEYLMILQSYNLNEMQRKEVQKLIDTLQS